MFLAPATAGCKAFSLLSMHCLRKIFRCLSQNLPLFRCFDSSCNLFSSAFMALLSSRKLDDILDKRKIVVRQAEAHLSHAVWVAREETHMEKGWRTPCIGYLSHPFEKMDRLPLQMRSIGSLFSSREAIHTEEEAKNTYSVYANNKQRQGGSPVKQDCCLPFSCSPHRV
jgi:hypothetical protein